MQERSDLPLPLDYRMPGTPGPGGEVIFRWLCTRHCLGVAGAALGVVVGAAVLLLSAWAVSGFVSMIVARAGGIEQSDAVGWTVFFGYLLVVAPLLLWRTVRTGGEFHADQVIASDAFHGKPTNTSEWHHRADVARVALYGDLLFWGPRLIVDGARRLAGRDVVRSADTLRRASFILSHLLRAEDAVRTKALRCPDEPADGFGRVLRWLDRHDYIGISADGQRVWLGSDVRQTLSLMLNLGPRLKRARRIAPGAIGTKSSIGVQRVAV